MPKRDDSGGARETERRRRERDANRPRGWAARQRRAFGAAIRGKSGIELALAIAEHAARWAGKDPGLPPEYLRQQQIAAAQTLGKIANPEKIIREQAVLIDDLTRVIEGQKDADAVPVARGGSGPGQAAPH